MLVRHRTGYRYVSPVRASYNEARLTPLSDGGQRTLESTVTVTPAVRPLRYVDYWGTTVDAFDVHVPHVELVVQASSVVETVGPPPAPSGLSWEDLADPAAVDPYTEFLVPSSYVPYEEELAQVARGLAEGAGTVEAGRRAAEWTHGALQYERGATHVRTTATEARQAGKGVCQDFAHVTLALLRAMGLPARYVSGYLHPRVDGAVGETTRGESHAWVEYWAGDWVAVDPTSLAEVGERHVRVARGRDYADVRPLSGIYSGPPTESFGVTVELTRLR